MRYNIHRYNCIGQYGGQHTIRKEVWLMLRLLVLLIELLRDVKTITITLKK